MGSKQTKIEGSYLPDTPTIQRANNCATGMRQTCSLMTDADAATEAIELDPRSPIGCRTPISILYKRPEQQPKPTQQSLDNPFSMFRKRLLKGLNYNTQDPRSPGLNRTPMILDENEKTFNMDDTFADLFVDTRVPKNILEKAPENEHVESEVMELDEAIEEGVGVCQEQGGNCNDSVEINSFVSAVEEETMPCPAKLNQTPLELQQQFDPRSPTFGLERTPIIFNDDDEIKEDAMLENILATLSLNISSSSSMASFNVKASPTNKACTLDKSPELVTDNKKLPSNKPLERLRRNGGRQVQRKQSKLVIRHRQRIYEDHENALSILTEGSTPKKRNAKDDGRSESKRTPLSCVKNRTHLRSRSVESSGKSLKARLTLLSFDDSLNLLENKKRTKSIRQELDFSLEI